MAAKESVALMKRLDHATDDDLLGQPAEALVATIRDLQNQNISNLGDGQIFVRRGADGEVQAVRGMMTLSSVRKEIYAITKADKQHGNYNVTADGYRRLNQIAGVNIVTPATLKLPNGKEVVNPYMVREGDRTIGIWVKKVAIGLSPLGTIVRVDATLYFDLTVYFLQDIASKINFYKNAGDIVLETSLTAEDRKKFMILPWSYGLVLKADPAHEEIRKTISTQIQREKFAERIATTICERNVLKKHPALAYAAVSAKVRSEYDAEARLPVFGWVKREMEQKMQAACDATAEGEATPEIETQSIHIDTEELEDGEAADAAEEAMGSEKTTTSTANGGKHFQDEERDPGSDDEEQPEPLFPENVDNPEGRRAFLESAHGKTKVAKALDEIPMPYKNMDVREKLKALDEVAEKLAEKE